MYPFYRWETHFCQKKKRDVTCITELARGVAGSLLPLKHSKRTCPKKCMCGSLSWESFPERKSTCSYSEQEVEALEGEWGGRKQIFSSVSWRLMQTRRSLQSGHKTKWRCSAGHRTTPLLAPCLLHLYPSWKLNWCVPFLCPEKRQGTNLYRQRTSVLTPGMSFLTSFSRTRPPHSSCLKIHVWNLKY